LKEKELRDKREIKNRYQSYLTVRSKTRNKRKKTTSHNHKEEEEGPVQDLSISLSYCNSMQERRGKG